MRNSKRKRCSIHDNDNDDHDDDYNDINNDTDDDSDSYRGDDIDDYDYGDPFLVDDRREKDRCEKRVEPQYLEKFKMISGKIRNKNIKYNDIMKLDLPDEEAIWFIEHINILNDTQYNTEDHYRIKNLIYERYKDLSKNLKNNEVLEKLREFGSIETNIVTRICESPHNNVIKSILYKKFTLINNANGSDEYLKVVEWIDSILDLPTDIGLKKVANKSPNDMLIKLRDSLNSKVYGLDHVKEKIMEAYCAMLTNPNYNKKIIALVGPPGTGKTAVGKAIADAFKQPFFQISMGSIRDSNILTGHSMTYIGSRPGLFVNILKQSRVLDPVILLDEIDKIPHSSEGQSVNSVLLHVLDKTQNSNFQDMYMPEIPIDLSHVFFILAMNNDQIIDPILKDRLCVIHIDGYDVQEKVIIARDYILPKVINELNFDLKDIIIDDTCIKYIIEKSTCDDSGVRELERNISTLCERLNLLKNTIKAPKTKKIKLSYSIGNLSFPIHITRNIVDTLLDI